MEFIKNVSAIVGMVLAVINLLVFFTKGGRTIVLKAVKKINKEGEERNTQQDNKIEELHEKYEGLHELYEDMSLQLECIMEFSKQSLRDTIKCIYYKYCQEKKIPLYERKTADYAYKLYTDKFNGNTYAGLLYKEICKWEIIPEVFEDMED